MTKEDTLVWVAVVFAAILLLFTPLIIASIRNVESVGLVVLLTALTGATGVTWFAALYMACTLPRRRPPPVQWY